MHVLLASVWRPVALRIWSSPCDSNPRLFGWGGIHLLCLLPLLDFCQGLFDGRRKFVLVRRFLYDGSTLELASVLLNGASGFNEILTTEAYDSPAWLHKRRYIFKSLPLNVGHHSAFGWIPYYQ